MYYSFIFVIFSTVTSKFNSQKSQEDENVNGSGGKRLSAVSMASNNSSTMLDADFDSVVSDLWQRFILTIFSNLNYFSQARPRESRLEHKTANRAKAPKRRPPSTMFVREAVSEKTCIYV